MSLAWLSSIAQSSLRLAVWFGQGHTSGPAKIALLLDCCGLAVLPETYGWEPDQRAALPWWLEWAQHCHQVSADRCTYATCELLQSVPPQHTWLSAIWDPSSQARSVNENRTNGLSRSAKHSFWGSSWNIFQVQGKGRHLGQQRLARIL